MENTQCFCFFLNSKLNDKTKHERITISCSKIDDETLYLISESSFR